MHPVTRLQMDSQSAVLDATRQSQAWVIAAVDRLARGPHRRPRPVGRWWRFQLDLAATLFGEPTGIIDQTYGHVGRLVDLQREFGQRLLDTVDTGDIPGRAGDSRGSDPTSTGQVLQFARPVRRSR